MVDFQERDTSRGYDEGDAEDDSSAAPDEDRRGHDSEHDRAHDHEHDADDLGVAVVTISSTRTIEEDDSGDAIERAIEDAGHGVVTRELVGDDHDSVQRTVDSLVRRADVDVVITTGGTGVTPDDVTVEAVRPLFEKKLPGFGELFRRYSEGEIGTRIVATRATAGVADGVPVFCLPGSENAAALGTEEIILPEASHLAGLARRDDDGDETSDRGGPAESG